MILSAHKMDVDAVVKVLSPVIDAIKRRLPDLKFIIAGGAVRDILLHRPFNDVDLVVQDDEELTPQVLTILGDIFQTVFQNALGEDADSQTASDPGEDAGRSQWPTIIYAGAGADVIVVPDMIAYVNDFPDDISKAYIDSDAQVHMTPDFVTGHDNRRITYRESAGAGRLLKLIGYFPSYSVTHVA
jgi:Poly A polymerase head domain